MMMFEEFVEKIREDIESKFPDATISIQKVKKNNGIELTAIVPKMEEEQIAPCIYLNKYYDDYLDGRPLNNITYDVVSLYEKNRHPEGFEINQILNYSMAAERIRGRMINYELNKEYLATVPHVRMDDFAITFHVILGAQDGEVASCTVTNDVMDRWQLTMDELQNQLQKNMHEAKEYRIQSMYDIIAELTMIDEIPMPVFEDVKMHVLTNKSKMHGAVEILNPEVQDELANIYGDKYCVIPSSVHEVIIIPYDNEPGRSVDEMESIIYEVNTSQLSQEEILSENMYMVDAKTHTFMRLDQAIKLEQQKEMEVLQEEKKSYVNATEQKPRGPKM